MATARHFQTRVLTPDETSLENNEIRLNSLLNQAQSYCHALNDLQISQNNNQSLQQLEFNTWSSKMHEQIDHLYKSCLNELQQSFEQLKLFQQIMNNILNNDKENNLDRKKLLAIEHEICILKCLTYQLDTTKVKIQGNMKKITYVDNKQCETSIDDDDDDDNNDNQTSQNTIKKENNFLCRILIHKDTINKIENLSIIPQYVQMTTKSIDDTTPERILTIVGPDRLNVIEKILSSLYSNSFNQCELRILLHQSYAPLILGKLGDRSKFLREKYCLNTLTIHPTCAPHSTERVLLIRSLSPDKILACLEEIFKNIIQNACNNDEILLYDETYYDPSLAHEYGGFASSELVTRSNEQHDERNDKSIVEDDDYNQDDEIRRYSALDAWNGVVETDTDELPIVKLANDSIVRQFYIDHGQFGALLGPHGVRIAQIRSQCRTVRIHTVAGSSIDNCSVKVIGRRADVNHAVTLIMQSIKEHDRKFPFKHHRFSGRLR